MQILFASSFFINIDRPNNRTCSILVFSSTFFSSTLIYMEFARRWYLYKTFLWRSATPSEKFVVITMNLYASGILRFVFEDDFWSLLCLLRSPPSPHSCSPFVFYKIILQLHVCISTICTMKWFLCLRDYQGSSGIIFSIFFFIKLSC